MPTENKIDWGKRLKALRIRRGELSESIVSSLLEDCYCTCQKCGTQFDYCKVPEAGMGYIKCPGCGTTITQDQCPEPMAPPAGLKPATS